MSSNFFRSLAFPDHGLPEVIRSKYKLRILWDLQHGSRRFGEIRKRLSRGAAATKEVAPRVLGRELKSLVEFGLLHRRAYEVVPPRVEYRLTAAGRSLLPVISKMVQWGTRHPSCRPNPKKALPVRSGLSVVLPQGRVMDASLKYPWQELVLEACGASSEALPAKINIAERAIAARLNDPHLFDDYERIALKYELNVLRVLLAETRARRASADEDPGKKKEIA